MLKSDRPAPFFIGEHRALDFLNSIAAPKATEIEWLESGADLLDWLVQSELCHESEIEHLRASEFAPALDEALGRVRGLRDDFRDFIRSISGTTGLPPEHPMISRLNDLLKAGRQYPMVKIGSEEHSAPQTQPTSAVLETVHVYGTPDDLLPRIAAACADLICEADFRYVRNCEGPTCTMYFLDISKNHKRRWCSMEVCGNRAKAAAFRNR